MSSKTTTLGNTKLTMSTSVANVKPRRLQAKWTVDAQQDLSAFGKRSPAWLWRHYDEINDRLRYLTSGTIPSRWLERDLYESMAKEIKDEIDGAILESLRIIHPGKEE